MTSSKPSRPAIGHLPSSVLVFVLLLTGCSTNVGQDSNTGVFKTADEAAEARKKKLLLDWQELAARIANAERPDVKTRKGEEFSLVMSADGVERTVDLSPLHERLRSANGREREPIRAFLAAQWPEFDRERLKAGGFAKVKDLLRPRLMNGAEAAKWPAAVANPVVIDLAWLPVVRWSADARSPVDREVVAAWGVPEAEVNRAALDNLKREAAAMPSMFETTELPGLGRYGSLRPGVDPAVVLLPEFLAAVRKEWTTAAPIVVNMPSRTSVTFAEMTNQKLLDRVVPEWQKAYAKVQEPLITQMVLVGDQGVALFSFTPTSTTKPAATKAATKPTGYIVR